MTLSRPAELSRALGIDFSEQQLQAITAPLEPSVIIAGAGSGKTTVMAARVVWLVGSGQVRPDEVLGLTFTRKAAGELGARVRQALIRAGVLTADGEAGEELILTYDAFAGRLVSEYGLLLGIEPGARLITTPARYRLAARVVADAAGPLRSLARLRPEVITERLLQLSQELSSHLVDPLALARQAELFVAAVEQSPRNNRGDVYADLKTARAVAAERLELAGLVVAYEELKAELGYVEFADQMAQAARLADQVPSVAAALRREFAVVLLDEYQDTSAAQASLLRGLFSGPDPEAGRGHPVTAVGDPCQAIYGWRGAAASNVLEFARHFPAGDGSAAKAYPLTVNRRSGQRVLDAANHLASPVRSEPALAAYGLDLDLLAPPGTPPGRVEVASYVTWPQEVAAIADRVAALHAGGQVANWSQIAVLARRNSQVADVYAALAAREVPAEIVGLGGLLDLPPIQDVVATLTLLADVTANPHLVHLLVSSRWAIGLPDLALLGRRAWELAGAGAHQEGSTLLPGADPAGVPSLLEAIAAPGSLPFSAAARQRFARLSREFALLRRHGGDQVTELVARVISVLGLTVELETVRPGASAPLATFVQAVADYADIDADASLTGLLAYLAAEREYGTGLEQPMPLAADAVKVLTVHKAKGLEWEVVFVPGLAAGVFPTDRVTGNWLRNAAVLPYPLRGDSAALPQLGVVDQPAVAGFASALTEQQRLSEDRLAYVAVTRARQLLLASTHAWAPLLTKMRLPSDYFSAVAHHAQVVDLADPAPQQNPLLADLVASPWPVAEDEDAQHRRREAAAAVRAARRTPSEPGALARARPAGRPTEPGEAGSIDGSGLSADERLLVDGWSRLSAALLQAERSADRRGRGPELPDYLSVTGLSRLVEDPERFAEALRRPMPRRVSQAQRWGIDFHRWLEQRFQRQVPLLDAAPDDELVGEALDEARDAFEAGPYGQRVPVAVEAPFTLVLAGRLIRGRIDAVFADERGRPQVVDWKTGDARRSDPLQLACYRLAWAELHELRVDQVDAVFYDLRTGEVVRPAGLLGRPELEALLARLPGSLA